MGLFSDIPKKAKQRSEGVLGSQQLEWSNHQGEQQAHDERRDCSQNGRSNSTPALLFFFLKSTEMALLESF